MTRDTNVFIFLIIRKWTERLTTSICMVTLDIVTGYILGGWERDESLIHPMNDSDVG